jgi:hypothetical protein
MCLKTPINSIALQRYKKYLKLANDYKQTIMIITFYVKKQ